MPVWQKNPALIPVGRKSLKLMPELMMKGGKYGERRVRENLPELEAMVLAEAERIKALQGNQLQH